MSSSVFSKIRVVTLRESGACSASRSSVGFGHIIVPLAAGWPITPPFSQEGIAVAGKAHELIAVMGFIAGGYGYCQ